ncbi:MAG: hypothetical protein ACK56F_29470, partial [bacterium]
AKQHTMTSTRNPHHFDSECESNVFQLKMKIKASLFTGKSTVHLSNKSEQSDIHPYDFYVGLWMGGSNENMEYHMLKGHEDGSGIASVSVPIFDTDIDHLKLGLYIRDPETKIIRHILSGYKSLKDVASFIDGVS